MPKRVLVLFAVSGLLAFAVAVPRPDSVIHAKLRAGHHLDRDSIRSLRAQLRHAAQPSDIDVNRVIKHPRPDPKPEPLDVPDQLELCDEFMPAPNADDGDQCSPAVAFDGTNYLVVWEDQRDGYLDIYGTLIKADGTLLNRTGFQISTMETYTWSPPSVAFNGTDYLVVWMDEDGDIYGAKVDVAGEEVVPITILADAAWKVTPSVASDGEGWLVIWADWSDALVHGALVDADGTPHVISDPISDGTWWDDVPSVGFGGSHYLAVWEEQGNGDIRGALIDPDNGAVETRWYITTGWEGAFAPAVASDSTDFLVVWDDGSGVYGAMVDPESGPEDPFAVSTNGGVVASVAFDGTDYVVVWEDDNDGYVHGCRVSPAKEIGDDYAISTRTSGSPSVACGPDEYTALVTYQSVTGVVGGHDYGDDNRIWARPGILPMDGNVGAVSIERPVASFLMPSWPIPSVARVKNYGSLEFPQYLDIISSN